MKLVLITGAGASARIGYNNGGLPLMQGWSADLRTRLGTEYARLLRLDEEIDGPEFEHRLGNFLRFADALPAVAQFPGVGCAGGRPAAPGAAEAWFDHAPHVTAHVLRIVFESLHSLFGGHKVSEYAARAAYEPILRGSGEPTVTLATTNYDVAGEKAFEVLGLRPYAGVDPSFLNLPTVPLHLDDLTASPNRTPVLYLHGRVGWYRDNNGALVATDPDAQYNPDAGVPVLLLPDLDKSYEDEAHKTVWAQFRTELESADRVLVVGHSLHDQQLVDALRPVADLSLGIAVHCPGADAKVVGSDIEQLRARLGRNCVCLPMDFGPQPRVEQTRWEAWVQGNRPVAENQWGNMIEL